jgi:hypothetical protein
VVVIDPVRGDDSPGAIGAPLAVHKDGTGAVVLNLSSGEFTGPAIAKH